MRCCHDYTKTISETTVNHTKTQTKTTAQTSASVQGDVMEPFDYLWSGMCRVNTIKFPLPNAYKVSQKINGNCNVFSIKACLVLVINTLVLLVLY